MLGDRRGVGAQIEDALDTRGEGERPRRECRGHPRLQVGRAVADDLEPPLGEPSPPGTIARFLESGERPRREERQQRLEVERRMKREAQGQRGAGSFRQRAKLRGSAAEAAADRFVEPAQALEARGVRDVDDPERGGLEELPREVQAARPEHLRRRCSEMAREEPPQVPVGDPEAIGEARRVARFLEQAQRTRECRGGSGLRRRSRCGVGPAAEAGAESCCLRGGRGRKEDDVLAPRHARRAAGAAIDVRRPHAEEEAAGEAGVTPLDRAIAGFGIHRRSE